MSETRTALLARAETTAADRSAVVRRFDDGWTIRRPTTFSDLDRVGKLMGNCLDLEYVYRCQYAGPYDLHPSWPTEDGEPVDAITEEQYERILAQLDQELPFVSRHRWLADPDGLPRAIYWLDQNGRAREVRGRHNSAPKQAYLERIG